MTSNQPGDRRRLARPPSSRYAATDRSPGSAGSAATSDSGAARPASGSALIGPLGRALVVAIIGAAALVFVGAVLSSTFGLLFVGGAMGAGAGLLLARATVPAEGDVHPATRATVSRLAIAIAVLATVAGYLGIWLYARSEGGTLELLDYLWTTFGLFVPGAALVAVVAAAWGASAGPVQR